MLELADAARRGTGSRLAAEVLADGRAWLKFQRICEAQGGMRRPPSADHRRPVVADKTGEVALIDNRRLAMVAKLAGAPEASAAGLELHVRLGAVVKKRDPLFTVHAESPGELTYAFEYLSINSDIIVLEQP